MKEMILDTLGMEDEDAVSSQEKDDSEGIDACGTFKDEREAFETAVAEVMPWRHPG